MNETVGIEFSRGLPIQLLDEVIGCLRDAVKAYPPTWHDVLFALANRLFARYTKLIQMMIMMMQRRYWKGSSIPITPESVLI